MSLALILYTYVIASTSYIVLDQHRWTIFPFSPFSLTSPLLCTQPSHKYTLCIALFRDLVLSVDNYVIRSLTYTVYSSEDTADNGHTKVKCYLISGCFRLPGRRGGIKGRYFHIANAYHGVLGEDHGIPPDEHDCTRNGKNQGEKDRKSES